MPSYLGDRPLGASPHVTALLLKERVNEWGDGGRTQHHEHTYQEEDGDDRQEPPLLIVAKEVNELPDYAV